MNALVERVVLHSGLAAAAAERATAIVLAGLRRELGQPEADAVADALPPELAGVLRHGRYDADRDLASFVAAAEKVSTVDALEQAASVCRALAELLPEATVARLRRALPASTARLFVSSSVEHAHEAELRRAGRTLAGGRPGSAHPLSEAAPRRVQAHSVVASDNPHGDTKLSSSRGLTQEREHESLADGRPGPRRPLTDAKS